MVNGVVEFFFIGLSGLIILVIFGVSRLILDFN